MRYAVSQPPLRLETSTCPKQVGIGGAPFLRLTLDHGQDFDVPAHSNSGTVATVNGVPVMEKAKDGNVEFFRWKPDWKQDAERAGQVLSELAGTPATAAQEPPAAAPAAPAAPAATDAPPAPAAPTGAPKGKGK